MLKTIGWRLVQAVLSMLVVTAGLFIVLRLTGKPENFIAHEGSTLEQRAQLRAALGLDEPLYKQFYIYIDNVLHGNLGTSYSFGVPVSDLIRDRFPNTVILTSGAMLLIFAFEVVITFYQIYAARGR